MNNFVLQGRPTHPLTFEELCDRENIKIPLSFENQLMVLNSLSNDSTPDGKSSVSFYSYFSTGTCEISDAETTSLSSKYLPTSVRNKVIYFKRRGDVSSVNKILFGTQSSKKRTQVSSDNSSSSDTSRTKRQKHDSSKTELSQEDIFDGTFPSAESCTSPFSKFCESIVSEKGLLKWRIHSPDLDVVVMNDVGLESGIFQTNNFVHVSFISSSKYSCTCRVFSTSMRMSSTSTHTTNCIHVRFFHEVIVPKYKELFSDRISPVPHSTLDSKLISALDSINIPVLKIDSNLAHHRFSVLSRSLKSSCFVNLNGSRFSCMDGKCRAGCGHKRKVQSLAESPCQHLRTIDDHRELWLPLVVEENTATQSSLVRYNC